MSPDFESYLSPLATLGIALCCGLPLLIFAAIAFFSARKHGQNMTRINSAVPSSIASLKPANQLVRLEGVVRKVQNAIDGPEISPLALVRLKVEIYEHDIDASGWRGAGDKLRSTPFQLEDETGTIWVDPQGLDKISLGEGIVPATREIAEAAAIQVGINPRVFNSESRARLWELRGGQRVTVIGAVSQRDGNLVVGKLKKEPFVVSPLLGNSIQVPAQKQVKTGRLMALLLGIPGVLVVACSLVWTVVTLIRLWQQ